MTTDITELAQSMKAAAENAIGAHERLAAYPYDEIIDISQLEGEQIDIDITDINEFHEEANPVNVLALVEALEKAQQERDNWRTSFDNERFRADKLKAHIDDIEPIRAAAEKLVRCKGRYHSELNYRALADLFGVTMPDLPPLEHENVHYADAAEMEIAALRQRIAELESRTVTVKLPDDLHPDTQELVIDFCTALAEKLYKAQLKYGYDADWKQAGWASQCQAHFHQHIAKGDPRDVAAYCAFMWWHGWSTKPTELESRTVAVKLPDYRNTYKGPFADEVEHQVRLALELFSSAAGINVEAE